MQTNTPCEITLADGAGHTFLSDRPSSFNVSDVPRPFDAQRDQGGRWFAQSHGINSSMRFCGQPFTRRVMRSVK